MLMKNEIVLLDQINLEREAGKEPFQAVVDASVSRVRPVCMAAFTTVLGMAPLLWDVFFNAMARDHHGRTHLCHGPHPARDTRALHPLLPRGPGTDRAEGRLSLNWQNRGECELAWTGICRPATAWGGVDTPRLPDTEGRRGKERRQDDSGRITPEGHTTIRLSRRRSYWSSSSRYASRRVRSCSSSASE